jgi:regulator of protease activity HflC (stomatin/prohibitin superfamily)
MRKTNSLAALIFIVIFGIGLAFAYSSFVIAAYGASMAIAVGSFILAVISFYAVRVADQWERAVVLRLGRFRALQGPGLFFIIPVLETVPYWIDTRVITTAFKAEKTLTKDTVPVDVDAVLFWKVIDPKKAALDVADYGSAIGWACQTALRDVIGKTLLSDMLEGREKISSELQRIIDIRTERRRWKTQCRCGRKPNGNDRRASFSAIRNGRLRRNSSPPRKPMRTIRRRSICAR